MKKIQGLLIAISLLSLLAGCATQSSLNAPCPNFGASCSKTPVNGWDNH